MPPPIRLYLVRHGQSEANLDKTVNARLPDHRVRPAWSLETSRLSFGGRLAGLFSGLEIPFPGNRDGPVQETRLECRLLRGKSEKLSLPRPFGRHVHEACNPHSTEQPTLDGRRDQIGRKEGKRDCHVRLADAAARALRRPPTSRLQVPTQSVRVNRMHISLRPVTSITTMCSLAQRRARSHHAIGPPADQWVVCYQLPHPRSNPQRCNLPILSPIGLIECR
jgi:hypothetical protein